MRRCVAKDLGSYAQGQGQNQVKGQNRISAITQNTQGQSHNHVRGQIVPKIVLLINY